jgi:NAD(P)-dependent dehydrogenase (short-subunit alcohol dehydrogenase family)
VNVGLVNLGLVNLGLVNVGLVNLGLVNVGLVSVDREEEFSDMGSLSGKVIIVTGASRGIGAAAAMALAREGATVMLAARDAALAAEVADSIIEAGGLAHSTPCDVSDYAAVEWLVLETEGRFDRIDALINNAGVIEPIATIAESDPVEWARNIQINLIGAYNPIRAVLPRMLKAGGGTIVNVSSGAALRPLEGWSAYCAGKAGLAMLTQSVMLENTANNIRVFGFQGTTDTDMQVTIRASGINMVSKIPRENLTPVAHPAAAIAYLCTPAADDLNGQEFSLRDEAFRKRLNLEG